VCTGRGFESHAFAKPPVQLLTRIPDEQEAVSGARPQGWLFCGTRDISQLRASGVRLPAVYTIPSGYTVRVCAFTRAFAFFMVQQSSSRRSNPAAAAPSEPADAVRISVLISKDERQQLKVLAASRGVTISEVVREGIARFLGSAS